MRCFIPFINNPIRINKRKFAAALTCFLGLFLTSGGASAKDRLTAAAFVNDDIITVVDVASRVNLALLDTSQPDTPQTRARLQKLVLDNLINESLQIQEARRVGIDLPSTEVNETAARIARQNGKNLSQFLSQLEAEGVSRQTLPNQIKAQLSWQILIQRRFGSLANISDEEVAEVRASFRSGANANERLLSEIYLPFSGNSSVNQTRATMASLITDIKGGKNFSAVAQQFSQAPTAVEGGDLGWIRVGELVPELERGLVSLPAGEISEAIQTPDGLYLFAVRDIRPVGKRKVGSEVRLLQLFFTLPTDLESIEAQQKLARAAAIIQSVEGCEQFASAIDRYGEPGSGDMGFVNPRDLPADLIQVANRIEIGRVTPPYPVPNGGALFMVCERKELVEDVSDEEIKARLIDERLSEVAKRYLRELRSRAFIRTRLR